jgi:hypothetical protein
MMIKLQLRFVFVSILLLLTACGSSGSDGTPNSGDSTTSTGLPNDINGLIVLNVEGELGKGYRQGTYMIDFKKGQVKTHKLLTSPQNGINPYAHNRNTITYAEPCGEGPYSHSRTKIINEKRLSSAPIVPCSSKFIAGSGVYVVAKISPDKSKIVIEVDNGGFTITNYLVKVFDRNTGEELFSFTGYDSPEWLLDGSLLMTSSVYNDNKGIFITSKDFTSLTRIDGGIINQSISFLSVNPLGDRLIFTMSGQLWMMNIDSNHTLSNLQELVSVGASIQTPTWSPKGKYIAFLSYSGSGRHFKSAGAAERNITFWDVNSKKSYVFDLTTVFPINQNVNDKYRPGAYMSWVQ